MRLGIPGRRLVGLLLTLALAGSLAAGAPAQTAPTGIDVSNWQGRIDWLSVSGEGIDFAFMKATEGTTFTDVTYPLNREGAGSIGVPIGAYHFARPSGAHRRGDRGECDCPGGRLRRVRPAGRR